ncbi:hypothetical protein JCM10213v2_008812 [Rhodosporidiobolus nylandii]
MPARLSAASIAPARATLLALLVGLLVFLQFGAVGAQETTLTQEDNGAVVTTSIEPTVYTTDGAVLTFVPTTPSATLAPLSTGSVMAIQDYISTISGSGAGAATGSVNRNLRENYATSGAEKKGWRTGWSAAAAGAVAATVAAVALI